MPMPLGQGSGSFAVKGTGASHSVRGVHAGSRPARGARAFLKRRCANRFQWLCAYRFLFFPRLRLAARPVETTGFSRSAVPRPRRHAMPGASAGRPGPTTTKDGIATRVWSDPLPISPISVSGEVGGRHWDDLKHRRLARPCACESSKDPHSWSHADTRLFTDPFRRPDDADFHCCASSGIQTLKAMR